MIKGLKPALAECGKIKIGGLGGTRKSKSGKSWRMPMKFDHFKVTKTYRGSDDNFAIDEELMARLPKDEDGKCREIPIFLNGDSIEDVFAYNYAAYSGSSLACMGDGETAVEGGKERPCPCDRLGAKSGVICKPKATLFCTINIPDLAVAGAVYKWRTTSIISIEQMLGSLQQVLAIVGSFRSVPLTLKVQTIKVHPDGKATDVHVCHVELRAKEVIEVQRLAIESRKIRESLASGRDLDTAYRALLNAPESPTEQRETAEEFYGQYSEPETERPFDAPALEPEVVNDADDAAEISKRIAEATSKEELKTAALGAESLPQDFREQVRKLYVAKLKEFNDAKKS
jgi:hypothetical protein